MILGDSLEVLKTMPSDSVDSLVTDPPAGISFMGKEWDSDKGGRDHWIAWLTEVMRECYRVLKPGAHGLVWAIPRTSHWTATALENAGFEVRDVITHLFGTGFPKSLDISKAIDKAAGAEREVVGFNPIAAAKANKKLSGEMNARYRNSKAANDNGATITAPATDAAKQWSGFGTALKPASEHWILVRKPLGEKTVAANVLKHGTGGLNIDGCRVGFQSEADKASAKPQGAATSKQAKDGLAKAAGVDSERISFEVNQNSQGRFPANLVLSHNEDCDATCSDSCAVAELDRQNGFLHGAGNKSTRTKHDDSYSIFGMGGGAPTKLYDRGGTASRFFYCAKASKSDRNAGCEGLPEKETGIKNASGRGFSENDPYKKVMNQNNHPTVKSTALMRYLCRLVTPPNGTILDPFMGSGSTGVAAIKEGFEFIGIELNPEYFEIANSRVRHVIPHLQNWPPRV